MKNPERGFTLVELVILIAFVGIFSSVLVFNLRQSATNTAVLERAALNVISDIRKSQSLAVSELTTAQGASVCGYGIHYLNSDSYLIYAGGEGVCGTANRNYQSGQDLDTQTAKIIEKSIEFKSSFNDVFFEPPDPKTYINNSFSLTNPALTISIGFKGLTCPVNCKTISVFPSGKIDLN